MNRKVFYDDVRPKLFRSGLSQMQVNGIEAILDEWEKRQLDKRWLAYILATAYHETAHTMQPIEEYGKGYKRAYGQTDAKTGKAYYGRGLVQLTWKYNYEKLGKILGIDLIHQPEQALRMDIAVKIMFEGMIRGLFTNRSLAMYFTPERSDWYNARRIVNGLDRATLIANYARTFHDAIVKASIPPTFKVPTS